MNHLLIVLMAVLILSCGEKSPGMYWYCAASMKKPAQEVVNLYNQSGGRVILITGGSGQVLNKMMSSGLGDIYTPASNHFAEVARKKGIVLEEKPLVEQTPVFAYSEKTTVTDFNDLWNKKLKIATGNPKSMALGRTWIAIEKKLPLDIQKGFEKSITVTPVNISQTVNYFKTETIDAGLVFDSVARVNNLPYIAIPDRYNQVERASLMLVTFTSSKNEAQEFITFIRKHKNIFREHGFTVSE